MTLGVYSGWDLLNPWVGGPPNTITYAAPKACIDDGNTNAVLVVMFGFSITGTASPPTPTISYGNCVGTATVSAAVWNGFMTDSVFMFTGWVPLDGYNGASQDISIDNLGAVNLDTLLNSAEGGAFGLVIYNVDPTLNATPWSTIQIMPDSPGQSPSDPPQILTFATGNGDLLLGLGMNDTTGGSVACVSPSTATNSVQQLPATGGGTHGIGAFVAARAFCTADVTNLSFTNGPSSPYQGLRCIFGGFVVSEIPAPSSCDDHYDDTVLLLHMDGADGGTSFTDSSSFAHTIGSGFSGETSDAQVLFGTASFTGQSAGFVRVTPAFPLASELQIHPAEDFTVELAMWLATPDASHNGCLFSISAAPYKYFELYTQITTGKVVLQVVDSGGTVITQISSTSSVCDGLWHQIAATRSGTTYRLYVDGVKVAEDTQAGDAGSDATQVSMGMAVPGEGNADQFIDGFIDEVRYTKVARYTGATYTVASEAFPESQCSTPGPPPGSIILSGTFVPSSEYKAIEMDRLGSIKPRIYAPVPNRVARTKP